MIRKHYKLIIFLLVIFVIFLIYKENHNHYFNYTYLSDGYALKIKKKKKIDYGYSDYIKDELLTDKRLKLYTKKKKKKDQSIEHLYESITTNEKITIDSMEINLKQTLRESNLITMTIGLNDLIYHVAITPEMSEYQLNKIIEEIDNNLNKLIKEIKKYYPKTIYIIGYPNIPIENIYIKEGIDKLNELYQNTKGITYIATTDVIYNSDFLNPNNIYPSKEGYKKIADKVLQKLNKI